MQSKGTFISTLEFGIVKRLLWSWKNVVLNFTLDTPRRARDVVLFPFSNLKVNFKSKANSRFNINEKQNNVCLFHPQKQTSKV